MRVTFSSFTILLRVNFSEIGIFPSCFMHSVVGILLHFVINVPLNENQVFFWFADVQQRGASGKEITQWKWKNSYPRCDIHEYPRARPEYPPERRGGYPWTYTEKEKGKKSLFFWRVLILCLNQSENIKLSTFALLYVDWCVTTICHVVT